jgi:hypothetical protein
VPPSLLARVELRACIAAGKTEKTKLDRCVSTAHGLHCGLSVAQQKAVEHVAPLEFVPFLVGKAAFIIDFPMKRPYGKPNFGLVAEVASCDITASWIMCPEHVQLTPDSCLEALLGTDYERVLNSCEIKQLPLDTEPFIKSDARSVLVAQRSDEAVVVAAGDEGVTEDPVRIYTSEKVKISYGLKSRTWPGYAATAQPLVQTLKYNVTVLRLFADHANPYRALLRDLIPQDLEEILLMITALLQLLLVFPCGICLYRYCRKGPLVQDPSTRGTVLGLGQYGTPHYKGKESKCWSLFEQVLRCRKSSRTLSGGRATDETMYVGKSALKEPNRRVSFGAMDEDEAGGGEQEDILLEAQQTLLDAREASKALAQIHLAALYAPPSSKEHRPQPRAPLCRQESPARQAYDRSCTTAVVHPKTSTM